MKNYGWKDLFVDASIIVVIVGAVLLSLGIFWEPIGKFIASLIWDNILYIEHCIGFALEVNRLYLEWKQ